MCKMHYHSIPMPEFILTIYVGKIKYKLEMLVKTFKWVIWIFEFYFIKAKFDLVHLMPVVLYAICSLKDHYNKRTSDNQEIRR